MIMVNTIYLFIYLIRQMAAYNGVICAEKTEVPVDEGVRRTMTMG